MIFVIAIESKPVVSVPSITYLFKWYTHFVFFIFNFKCTYSLETKVNNVNVSNLPTQDGLVSSSYSYLIKNTCIGNVISILYHKF